MTQKYYDIVRKKLKGKKKDFSNMSVISMDIPDSEVDSFKAAINGQNSIYTGAGPDGVVQPDRPAMMDMSAGAPKMLHEGEIATKNGNSVNVTPAPEAAMMMGNMQVPQTEEDQFKMAKVEKETGMPGYQEGGTYRTMDERSPLPTPAAGATPQQAPGTPPAPTSFKPGTPEALPSPVDTFQKQTTSDLAAMGAQTMAAQKATAQRSVSPYVTEGAKVAQQGEQERSAGLAKAEYLGDRAAGAVDLARGERAFEAQQEEAEFRRDFAQEQFDFAKQQYGDQEGQRIIGLINSGATFEMIQRENPDITQADYESMRAMYDQQLAGTELGLKARELGLDSQALTQLTNSINSGMSYDQIKQQFPDMSQEDYNSMRAMYNQTLTQSNLTTQAQKLGLNAQRSDNLIQNISAGMTYDQIKADFPEVTREQYESMRTVYDQQIEGNEIALTGQRLGLTERNTKNLISNISSGMSYEQVKAMYPNVSRADYNSLKEVYNAQLEGIRLDNTGRILGMDAQKINNITGAINQGMSFAQVQTMYPDIQLSDYNSLKTMYDLKVKGVELGLNAQQTDELAASIANGQSYWQVREKYPNISMDSYESMRTMYNAQLKGVNLQNTAMELGLDAQQTVNMSNDIAAGMNYDQFKQRHPGVTETQYNSLKKMYDMQVKGIELGLDSQATGVLVDKINSGMTFNQISRTNPEITLQQYNAMKTKYDMQVQAEQFGLNAMEGEAITNAINQGQTFEQVRSQFPSLTQDMYESMKTLYDLQVQGANLDLNFKQLGLNAQESAQLTDAISQGQTFDQVKLNFPDTNLTKAMYDSMREASQIGAQDYQKRMDAVNMLIAGGGAANLQQANKLLGGLFPGMDIDFGNLANEQKANEFNQGMGNLSNYLSMEWSTAEKAMLADGTFDKLGMSQTDVKAMFEEMKLNTNPILAQEKLYHELWQEGKITEAEYEDLVAWQVWSVTNQQGVVITDSYQVYDQNGAEVQNFRTKAEADAFISDNPGFTKKMQENGWVTQGSGTGPGGTTGTDNLETAVNKFDDIGIIAEPLRIQEFLDEHGGKFPTNFEPSDWSKWDSKTPSASRITSFTNGDLTVTLSNSDRAHMDTIVDAQKRIDAGNGTDDDFSLVSSVGGVFGDGGDIPKNEIFETAPTDWRPGGGMGKLHKSMLRDNGVYNYPENNYASFRNETKDWIANNQGKTVKIDGKWYVVEGLQPKHEIDSQTVTSGTDAHTEKFYADAVILRTLDGSGDASGRIYETFGTEGKLWD